MNRKQTDYEVFEESTETRRLLRQEELILEVTEALTAALEGANVTRTQLAERLGKSKGFVSQILAGGRNLTLRTLADVADALGQAVRVKVCDREEWVDEVLETLTPEVWTWQTRRRGTFHVASGAQSSPSEVRIEAVA